MKKAILLFSAIIASQKKLDKRICYVDIAKTNEGITKDLPDPRCPLSKPINVIL